MCVFSSVRVSLSRGLVLFLLLVHRFSAQHRAHLCPQFICQDTIARYRVYMVSTVSPNSAWNICYSRRCFFFSFFHIHITSLTSLFGRHSIVNFASQCNAHIAERERIFFRVSFAYTMTAIHSHLFFFFVAAAERIREKKRKRNRSCVVCWMRSLCRSNATIQASIRHPYTCVSSNGKTMFAFCLLIHARTLYV